MQPTALFAKRRQIGVFGREVQRAMYQRELAEAAQMRATHLREADRAAARIAELLPGASDAGLRAEEIAEITGYSRASVYRLLSTARPQQDLAAEFVRYAVALENASAGLGHAAMLFDLAGFLGQDMEELTPALARLVGFGVERFDALGATGTIGLIDLLPRLPENEKIALAMTLSQRATLAAVAASMQRPEVEVAAWIVLGLLRVLPQLTAD
jgi:hypothetical protein